MSKEEKIKKKKMTAIFRRKQDRSEEVNPACRRRKYKKS